MMLAILLNKLGSVDRTFFLVILGIIVLCVAIYFLIPLFHKKYYQEQRKNLETRTKVFYENRNTKNTDSDQRTPNNQQKE